MKRLDIITHYGLLISLRLAKMTNRATLILLLGILAELCLSQQSDVNFQTNLQDIYNVTIENEQSIAINYSISPINAMENITIIITKQGVAIPNYYIISTGDSSGTIYLHFRKVALTDAGEYNLENGLTPSSSFTVKVNKQSIGLCKQETRDESFMLILYIVPAVCGFICIMIIITSVCLVRRKSVTLKTAAAKHKPVKKNDYVKTEDINPAQVATLPKQQQVPQINLTTPSTEHRSAEEQPPPVSQRTSSMNPVRFRDRGSIPEVNFQQSIDNRQSIDSMESWDDGEDEYMNTGSTAFNDPPPKTNVPFQPLSLQTKAKFKATTSSTQANMSVHSSSWNSPVVNNRPGLSSSTIDRFPRQPSPLAARNRVPSGNQNTSKFPLKLPPVALKPTTPSYVNQAHQVTMSYDDGQDVYEPMGTA